MPDRKPPRVAGDEKATLLALLGYQRSSFLRNLEGIDDEAARRSPVPSGTSLLWLGKHLAFAEEIWLRRRFLGEEVAPRNDLEPGDTVASVVAGYREVGARSDRIIGEHDLAEPMPDPDGGPVDVDLRWIVVHLIEEVARHAGHADVLRELLDGSTGR